ncbi:MAG: rhodanese-like domain-containing protein [Acetobacteraceae bacterium]
MPSFLSRLFATRPDPGWIEPADLAPLIATDDAPLIVDVRNPAEFTGPLGHIQGAANVPLDQFAARTAEVTGPARPVVLVCHTDRRSSAAAHHLRSLGCTEVLVLRGGMVAWQEAGLTGK